LLLRCPLFFCVSRRVPRRCLYVETVESFFVARCVSTRYMMRGGSISSALVQVCSCPCILYKLIAVFCVQACGCVSQTMKPTEGPSHVSYFLFFLTISRLSTLAMFLLGIGMPRPGRHFASTKKPRKTATPFLSRTLSLIFPSHVILSSSFSRYTFFLRSRVPNSLARRSSADFPELVQQLPEQLKKCR